MLIGHDPAVRGVFTGYIVSDLLASPWSMVFCPIHAHHFHLGVKIIQDLPGRERINLWGRRVLTTLR